MTTPIPPTTFKLTDAEKSDLDLIADTLPREQRNRTAAIRYAIGVTKTHLGMFAAPKPAPAPVPEPKKKKGGK